MADEKSPEDMQAKVTESTYERRVDQDGFIMFKGNQGTVVLGSPQDQERLRIGRAAIVDRRRAYAMPASSLSLPDGFKSEDE